MPLIRNLGANTLRVSGTWHVDADHGFFLDSAQEFGLKVIVTYAVTPRDQHFTHVDEFARQFQRYINHPALLGWSFGADLNAPATGWLSHFNTVGQCHYNGNDFNADHVGCFNNPATDGYCFDANACVYQQMMQFVNAAAVVAKNMMRGSQQSIVQQQRDAIWTSRQQKSDAQRAKDEASQQKEAEAQRAKDEAKAASQAKADAKAKAEADAKGDAKAKSSDKDKSAAELNASAAMKTNALVDAAVIDDSVDPDSIQPPDGLPHLIFTSFADADLIAQRLGAFSATHAPEIDAFGVASFRDENFRWSKDSTSLIEEWGAARVTKPLLVMEYGVDAYRDPCGTSSDSVCRNTVESDSATSFGEDESAHADWIMSLTRSLSTNSSAAHRDGLVLGGCVLEFVDQWWRDSVGVAGCAGPIPWNEPGFDPSFCGWKAHVDCPNLNLWSQTLCGYSTPSSFDRYNNVAFWGLFRAAPWATHADQLVPRLAYSQLQSHWNKGTSYILVLLLLLGALLSGLVIAWHIFRQWHFVRTGDDAQQLLHERQYSQLKESLLDGLQVTDLGGEGNSGTLFGDVAAPGSATQVRTGRNSEYSSISERTPLTHSHRQEAGVQ